MFELPLFSESKLKEIHSDLARVVRRCAEDFPDGMLTFIVTEGIRSREKQLKYVATGASRTMDSRHRTGHAVDLAARVDGEVRWDWPLYHRIAAAMKRAAEGELVDITWGGDWDSFQDGPHFELSRDKYPAPKQI